MHYFQVTCIAERLHTTSLSHLKEREGAGKKLDVKGWLRGDRHVGHSMRTWSSTGMPANCALQFNRVSNAPFPRCLQGSVGLKLPLLPHLLDSRHILLKFPLQLHQICSAPQPRLKATRRILKLSISPTKPVPKLPCLAASTEAGFRPSSLDPHGAPGNLGTAGTRSMQARPVSNHLEHRAQGGPKTQSAVATTPSHTPVPHR